MKKIIIAALALATAGFSAWSTPTPVYQIGVLEGCNANAGTTAVALVTSTSSAVDQYLIVSSSPLYPITVELAKEAVVSGKNVQIESTWPILYRYKVNGICFDGQGFTAIQGFALKR